MRGEGHRSLDLCRKEVDATRRRARNVSARGALSAPHTAPHTHTRVYHTQCHE